MDPLNTNLIFLDLETTGLRSAQDVILEIGILPVDANLTPLHEGWSTTVHPGSFPLSDLNPKVREMHTENGLLAALETDAPLQLFEAARQATRYCEAYVPRGQTPLAGSSIAFDRGFLERYMPGLNATFHYRNADVSSVKEFWKRWFPEAPEPPKVKAHRALEDCYASLGEAQWYKDHLMLDPVGPY